jgi:hypothetical protein
LGAPAAIHGAQLGQEHERQRRGPKTHPFALGQAIHALLKRRLGLRQFFDFAFAVLRSTTRPAATPRKNTTQMRKQTWKRTYRGGARRLALLGCQILPLQGG